mmetsp:Transcript_8713/g.8833  ORF Transcript_8713/g.8833 Transcript_8713/m.8833 type:complete len:101 (+) Transcript_8713:324-626(+)
MIYRLKHWILFLPLPKFLKLQIVVFSTEPEHTHFYKQFLTGLLVYPSFGRNEFFFGCHNPTIVVSLGSGGKTRENRMTRKCEALSFYFEEDKKSYEMHVF